MLEKLRAMVGESVEVYQDGIRYQGLLTYWGYPHEDGTYRLLSEITPGYVLIEFTLDQIWNVNQIQNYIWLKRS